MMLAVKDRTKYDTLIQAFGILVAERNQILISGDSDAAREFAERHALDPLPDTIKWSQVVHLARAAADGLPMWIQQAAINTLAAQRVTPLGVPTNDNANNRRAAWCLLLPERPMQDIFNVLEPIHTPEEVESCRNRN